MSRHQVAARDTSDDQAVSRALTLTLTLTGKIVRVLGLAKDDRLTTFFGG
jgi:hypothetical protein